MVKEIEEVYEEYQYVSIEEESYSMMKAWRFRFIFEIVGVSLVAFSFAAILFRRGFLSPDYLSILDVIMFYAGFMLVLISFLMYKEFYSIEGGN